MKNEVDHIDKTGGWRPRWRRARKQTNCSQHTALYSRPCLHTKSHIFVCRTLVFSKTFFPILLLSFFASLIYSVLLVRSSLLKRAFLNIFLQGDVDFISGLLQNCKNYQDNENLCIINSRSQQCCKNVWKCLREAQTAKMFEMFERGSDLLTQSHTRSQPTISSNNIGLVFFASQCCARLLKKDYNADDRRWINYS